MSNVQYPMINFEIGYSTYPTPARPVRREDQRAAVARQSGLRVDVARVERGAEVLRVGPWVVDRLASEPPDIQVAERASPVRGQQQFVPIRAHRNLLVGARRIELGHGDCGTERLTGARQGDPVDVLVAAGGTPIEVQRGGSFPVSSHVIPPLLRYRGIHRGAQGYRVHPDVTRPPAALPQRH